MLKEGTTMNCEQAKYEEEVLKQYNKLILKLSYKLHKSYNGKYAIEDIIQEAKIGAIRALRQYDPSKNVKLLTHLHNYINFYLSHFTRKDTGLIKIPKATNVESDKLPEIIDNGIFQTDFVNERCPVQENVSKDVEDKLLLNKCFSLLSEKEKNILQLVYIEGYTYNEVAEHYNVSRQYCNALAAKAIKKIQDKFSDLM